MKKSDDGRVPAARRLAVLAFFMLLVTAEPIAAADYKGVNIALESHSETYVRSHYKHWSDFDGDRLSTRHEVLQQESFTPVVIISKPNGSREVVGGLWVGRYTGLVTTDPAQLQIDHMVPLKEAHESGAWAWDSTLRERYANDMDDPGHLIAVKGGANGSKGDRDPADWMPPNRAYWCEYLTNWLEVKRRWALTMDQREADAVKKGERVCGRYTSGDKLEGRH